MRGTEIVDVGCGPGRVSKQLSKLLKKNNLITITGIDIDTDFLAYSKSHSGSNITFKKANIISYEHGIPVDVFFSIGVHHHIEKGWQMSQYLSNLHTQLADDGVYIISDEFIPDYTDENERDYSLAIWYSHVISHAIKNGFDYLALEEAHIFLDDLLEGRIEQLYKNEDQIQIVLASVSEISNATIEANKDHQKTAINKLLSTLEATFDSKFSTSKTSLTRRDYKVCDKVFRNEMKQAGFIVQSQKSFGDIEKTGGMSVYMLKKE